MSSEIPSSQKPATVGPCDSSPWYFLPWLGITPFALIAAVFYLIFLLCFFGTHRLMVSHRLEYLKVTYKSYRKGGFAGVRDVLRNLTSRLFREKWAKALRTEREQRAAEEEIRQNNPEPENTLDELKSVAFGFAILLLIVIFISASLMLLQKVEYPKCAHWAVVLTVGVLGLILSFAFYCWVVGVTPERFVPSTVAPAEPRAVEQGLESRPRDLVTRTAVSEEQQDEEPQAEERGMESPLRNSVSRESSYVAPQDLQSPSRGHQMELRPRNITRTASVGVQQDPEPPVERQRSQTEGAPSSIQELQLFPSGSHTSKKSKKR